MSQYNSTADNRQPVSVSTQPKGPSPAGIGAAWNHGIGITNRHTGDDECSCPGCRESGCCAYCCGLPLYFSDEKGDKVGQESTMRSGWCCGWRIEEADALGVPMSFEGEACGDGVYGCCQPQVKVYAGHEGSDRRYVGRAQRVCHCCGCCDEDMARAYDENDKLVFRRVQNVSCCANKYRKGGYCSCWCCACSDEFDWPVRDVATDRDSLAIRERACCCPCPCYGWFVGVPKWPAASEGQRELSDNHKMLMLGMVLTKWWRSADEAKAREEAEATAAA